jgi:hypothetical protein
MDYPRLRRLEAPMLSMFMLPWRWTREPRPGQAQPQRPGKEPAAS